MRYRLFDICRIRITFIDFEISFEYSNYMDIFGASWLFIVGIIYYDTMLFEPSNRCDATIFLRFSYFSCKNVPFLNSNSDLIIITNIRREKFEPFLSHRIPFAETIRKRVELPLFSTKQR